MLSVQPGESQTVTKIGVFDSGVGGQSIVNAIQSEFPDIVIEYAEDKKNVPYGTKTPDELFSLTLPILNTLSINGCKVIVIACNTVTTTIIERLRTALPVPLIGMEPMVKPAAEHTNSKVIAVCATPTTLASDRYKYLKYTYANGIRVLEPDCSDWASMIEDNDIDHHAIESRIRDVCMQGADTIVLGCTHYHWIEEDIIKIADKYKTKVIQPEAAIVKRLKVVLEQL
jgi:glutamate racemase